MLPNNVSIIINEKNMGVGGAFRSGVEALIGHEYTFVVKVDGDCQHTSEDVSCLVHTLKTGRYSFVKGR